MPWTAPVSESTGYVVTATDWDNFIYANSLFLYGDSSWTNVSAFSGTWVAGSVTPRYILIGRVVYLQGQLSAGTINTAAFTLPAGYRPSQNQSFATVSPAGAATIAEFTVASSGVVTPQAGSVTNFVINTTFCVV